MKKKKTWLAIRPDMFRAGSIEFHTDRATMIKQIRAKGATCESDCLDRCAGAVRYCDLNNYSTLYVFVGDGRLDTLIHECFHASVRYLAWVGVPLEHDEPNEAYAYFLEYLVREFKPYLKGKK